ncbi:hypothetical protein [Microcoleus sp. CAWBG58]|uniref:hypothetical protein n=1 Tax=Microcoleus sp. CAWBG58 TaxID=2841651 RepID=UPI0025FB669F|nr:hypothetical protein [Microcoleus sp. CAWBG58]
MAYSDFSLARVKDDFGLTLDETRDLFAATPSVAPSEILTTTLDDYQKELVESRNPWA